MSRPDPWLPVDYQLPGNWTCQRLCAAGDEWQIYRVSEGGKSLVVTGVLADRWQNSGVLASSQMAALPLGGRQFYTLHSAAEYCLAPVYEGSPDSKNDAIAFAAALKNTRERDSSTSLHDAIYIEQLSRLVPTYTLSPHVQDDVVLGTWLTGGVGVSVTSRRRLQSLLPWMSRSDVDQILARAGLFGSTADGSTRVRRDSASQEETAHKSKRIGGNDSANTRGVDSERLGAFHLPGRPDLEKLFNEHIIDIVRDPDRYKTFGIDFPTAIALHGPPGCGKTYAVEKLVDFLDWPIFTIDSNTIGSPFIHETSKKVAETFDKALDAAPSVIVIDEMESYLSTRQGAASSGHHHVEEVAEFLRRIPEANRNKVLVIGMTNQIDMIDPAILRRGRFDHIIEVRMPSAAEVSAALSELLETMPTDSSVDIDVLAQGLAGRPMSDAAYVVREAGRNAARSGLDTLTQSCLLEALDLVPNRSTEQRPKPIGFIWNE